MGETVEPEDIVRVDCWALCGCCVVELRRKVSVRVYLVYLGREGILS